MEVNTVGVEWYWCSVWWWWYWEGKRRREWYCLTGFYIKGGLGLKLGQGCVGWVERIRIVDWIWWLFY